MPKLVPLSTATAGAFTSAGDSHPRVATTRRGDSARSIFMTVERSAGGDRDATTGNMKPRAPDRGARGSSYRSASRSALRRARGRGPGFRALGGGLGRGRRELLELVHGLRGRHVRLRGGGRDLALHVVHRRFELPDALAERGA